MKWLPTFNERVLELPENVSIMMASILAISLAIDRMAAGVIVKHVSWVWVVTVCIVCAIAMVIVVLPKTVNAEVGVINTLSDTPLISYVFPILGLFIAPIYPLLNSTVLSAIPKRLPSPFTRLIVIFSALGGTLGSRIFGYLFKKCRCGYRFYIYHHSPYLTFNCGILIE